MHQSRGLPVPPGYSHVVVATGSRLGRAVGEHKRADTLVGVEALSGPEYLIEVDAIAVA